MNAVSSTSAAAPAAERTLADRLLAVIPLLSVYAWLCLVYLVEVWARSTPWLFGDELELTQLARSIADTGHPAERGTPMPAHSLYTYLMAPMWLIDHVPTAYAGEKYLNVFLMASVVFPTYHLARLVVGRRAALYAAAGAGAIPSLAYTGYLVEENLAYPYAALCFFLLAKAIVEVRRGAGRRWGAAALAATLVAPFVRGELGVIPGVAVLALLFAWWSSDTVRARREAWTPGAWLGVVTLVFGAVFLISGFGSKHSYAWLVATRGFKHRMLNMGGWAAGSLTIGLGVVPVAAGLAALVRLPGERPTRGLRAFRSTFVAAIVAFGLYTAIKAAYLSTTFATRVEERNLIYVSPLLFVGTALLLERRRVNLWALAGATVFAGYLAVYAMYHATQFPYEMDRDLYSDALGLALLQEGNRFLVYWTPQTVRWVLLALALGGALLLAALARWRGRTRLAAGLTAVLAAGTLGWTLTGQISAAAGSNRAAKQAAYTLTHPFSWVDDRTGGQRTLYMGAGEADPAPENLIEFWNRSIARVSSLDGTVGGPGPAGGPNLTADGTTYWNAAPGSSVDQFAYAVEDYPCVDFAGSLAATHPYHAGGTVKQWRLIRLTRPNRLQAMCTGIQPDGWTTAGDSSYYRFSGGSSGWLRIDVSRLTAPAAAGSSPVHVQVGPLGINDNAQPELARVTRQLDGSIAPNEEKVLWVRSPGPRFAVHLVVDSKFVPRDVDPSSSDGRPLGALVSYRYFKTLPPHARPTRGGF